MAFLKTPRGKKKPRRPAMFGHLDPFVSFSKFSDLGKRGFYVCEQGGEINEASRRFLPFPVAIQEFVLS